MKKIRKTYKMYMKTLAYLISRIKILILAVKDKRSTYGASLCVLTMQLIRDMPLHKAKSTLSIFHLKSDC